MWKQALIWLFVINLGVALGAGLYEARVVIPRWADIPPSSWPNTGVMFWVYVTTVPLTLLTIANLISAWLSDGRVRRWQLAAGLIVLVERVLTFSYFIPTMIGLMQSEGLPASEIQEGLSQWLFLNHIRHALTLCGWLAALKALSLVGERELRS
jgi:hypothetical protein